MTCYACASCLPDIRFLSTAKGTAYTNSFRIA
jgi:hypothetical protein